MNPTFWEQFGPWCVLAITLLLAIGYALRGLGGVFWRVYERMASALDEKDKAHAAELNALHAQALTVVENNTKILAVVADRLGRDAEGQG